MLGTRLSKQPVVKLQQPSTRLVDNFLPQMGLANGRSRVVKLLVVCKIATPVLLDSWLF